MADNIYLDDESDPADGELAYEDRLDVDNYEGFRVWPILLTVIIIALAFWWMKAGGSAFLFPR